MDFNSLYLFNRTELENIRILLTSEMYGCHRLTPYSWILKCEMTNRSKTAFAFLYDMQQFNLSKFMQNYSVSFSRILCIISAIPLKSIRLPLSKKSQSDTCIKSVKRKLGKHQHHAKSFSRIVYHLNMSAPF